MTVRPATHILIQHRPSIAFFAMTILRYLPILLVSATAYAQAGLTWVLSPINNHIYARTSPMTWPQAEALAVQLGGHLATIRNSQENQWVFQSFGSNVWIGFNDRANEVSWVWSSGVSSLWPNTAQTWTSKSA